MKVQNLFSISILTMTENTQNKECQIAILYPLFLVQYDFKKKF